MIDIYFFKKYRMFLISLGLISLTTLMLFYRVLTPKPFLPIYQPAEVNYKLVDSSLQHVKKYHRIADFNLINQNGDSISQDFYRDKIYIVDFFFTTCPSICPIMTKNMFQIQKKILNDPNVLLLSHTVDPETDSVAQLKKYSLLNGVIDLKWNLVTGDKKQIYNLARKSYFVAENDGDGGPNDMIHSENFVLVDPEKRIRGFYDGTDFKAIKSLFNDIEILKEEYSNFEKIN